MSSLPPVRREILVAAPPDRAFAVFTQRIGQWWPTSRLSVFGGGSVAFEDGRLVERAGDRASVWAEVVGWDPPTELRLAWHPGRPDEEATHVRVTFTARDDGTLVVVEHSGWEVLADPAATAEEYGNGWPTVLVELAGAVDGLPGDVTPNPDDEGGDRWFALLHRPGPAVPDGGSVFAAPEFGEHLAFLGRLQERGLLVAAGPLADEDGAGMTVVRVRREHGDVDVHALATTDDRCVVAGVLAVTVREWMVAASAV